MRARIKLSRLCWYGFGHGENGEFVDYDKYDDSLDRTPAKSHKDVLADFMAPSPHSTEEYSVIIADDKNEDYVCFAGMWWVPENKLAYMEPLCTAPVANTGIKHFEWCGKTVSDNDYKCLAKGNIEVLDINPTRFTLDELTDLLALFPESLSGSITKPYITGSVGSLGSSEQTTYNYLCKNKKVCVAGKGDERFWKYLNDFETLLKKKRS